MNIKTKYTGGVFVPLGKVDAVKEGEIVEIEIKPKKKILWRGALKGRKETSVELQHRIREMW